MRISKSARRAGDGMSAPRAGRRRFAGWALGAAMGTALSTPLTAAWAAGAAAPGSTAPQDPLLRACAVLEARLQARVGLYLLDTGTGQQWRYRPHERFPLNSTFKLLACAALLARADAGAVRLDQTVTILARDVVEYSPVTLTQVGRSGMSLAALCAAAMTMSDNTAANLILKVIGGPAGLTRFMRNIGDAFTRLDRYETALNQGTPGDPRDTTTPESMALSLHKLAFGNVLQPASRLQLQTWMLGNQVSENLLRAGLPPGWRVGDRTGAGGFGSRGIAAVLWPPGRYPLVAAIYLTETSAALVQRDAAIAELGRVIAALYSRRP